ncbi:MAG: VPLPA-CTERM sorting domain-containing protein [Pseudomonadota bacterium]
MKKTTLLRRVSAALTFAILAAPLAQGATYGVQQDTSIYEFQFVGNLGGGTGDSEGILVWNHENVHGTQALVQFDSAWMQDSALNGNFRATLNLYSYCTEGDFVGACPGYDGAETTQTDVYLQATAWDEADAALAWGDISARDDALFTTFEQSGTGGWISIDVTDLIQASLLSGVDYGFVLSQEAYDVIRADNTSIPVSQFCDSESSSGFCASGSFAPFLEIRPVPLPAAVWLFGAALAGLGAIRRKA